MKIYYVEYAYITASGNQSTDKKVFQKFTSALSQWGTWYANFIKMSDVEGFCLGITCTDGTSAKPWEYYECPDYVAPEEVTEQPRTERIFLLRTNDLWLVYKSRVDDSCDDMRIT